MTGIQAISSVWKRRVKTGPEISPSLSVAHVVLNEFHDGLPSCVVLFGPALDSNGFLCSILFVVKKINCVKIRQNLPLGGIIQKVFLVYNLLISITITITTPLLRFAGT